MSSFATHIHIRAAREAVWQVLADIGGIHAWNPGVDRSHLTSDADQGIGSSRYCDLGGGSYLDENVVRWEPERALTMRITRTNLPFQSADIRFTLEDESGGTRVTVSPLYELKFGLLGQVLDAVYVRRTYQSGMADLLQGLKEHIEGSVEAAG